MSKHRPLLAGETIPETWLNALQELLGTFVSPMTIKLASSTTVQIVAGAGNAQVGMAIMGKWRYITATVSAAVGGTPAAGVYPVFATASDNVFTGSGVAEVDSTNYSFALEIRTAGGTPTADLWRQIGTVTWDGAALTEVRPIIGGGGAEVPLGGVLDWPWASGAIPSWAVLAYGQLLANSAYPDMQALADVSGRPYGGTAGTNFVLPDYRGRVGAGKDNMGGVTAGAITAAISGTAGTVLGAPIGNEGVQLTTAEIPAHNHALGVHSHAITGSPTVSNGSLAATNGSLAATSGSLAVSPSSHSHIPPGIRGNFMTQLAEVGDANVWGSILDGAPFDWAMGETPTTDAVALGLSGSPGLSGSVALSGSVSGSAGSLGTADATPSIAPAGGDGVHRNVQPTIIVNKLMRVL